MFKRQWFANRDAVGINQAVKRYDFQSFGGVEALGIVRIYVGCEGDYVAVSSLNEIEHHGAMTLLNNRCQLIEVFCTPRCDTIRKFGKPSAA